MKIKIKNQRCWPNSDSCIYELMVCMNPDLGEQAAIGFARAYGGFPEIGNPLGGAQGLSTLVRLPLGMTCYGDPAEHTLEHASVESYAQQRGTYRVWFYFSRLPLMAPDDSSATDVSIQEQLVARVDSLARRVWRLEQQKRS